jgi:hypothetical protein
VDVRAAPLEGAALSFYLPDVGAGGRELARRWRRPYNASTMEALPSTLRRELLERVFPDLRYGGDPDIERYFELRASGRMLDALAVYTMRLKPRYPDDAKRIVLLRLYRTHSPAYADFLESLLMERADDIIARIQANIRVLVAPLEGLRLKDTYAVLKAVERIARRLPEDSEQAKAFASAYEDYAKLLKYRADEMARVSYLLGEFYEQGQLNDDEAPDFIGESLRFEEERRKVRQEAEHKNFFDLEKIEFDSADVRRIEIPQGLERNEDRVLAYCHKYWLRAEDPAFERIVWLYARKYDTKHFEVFKAIKLARRRKYADDEVLTLVATTIAERYSYTVQGDLYMQAAWRRIKAAIYGKAAVRLPPQQTQPNQRSQPAEAEAAAQPVPPGPASRPDRPLIEAKHPQPAPAVIQAADRPAGRLAVRPADPAPIKAYRQRLPQGGPALKAGGSISDKIKRLSGRAYDVYKELFLAKLRPHIRDALLAGKGSQAQLFGEELNKAENHVYDFMESNYANPYMDWASSEQREQLSLLGIELESIDPIIELCYRKISA